MIQICWNSNSFSPYVEPSSTRMISLTSCGGDRFSTEWTVRSNVVQASLWKIIITLALGNSLMGLYWIVLQLKKIVGKSMLDYSISLDKLCANSILTGDLLYIMICLVKVYNHFI